MASNTSKNSLFFKDTITPHINRHSSINSPNGCATRAALCLQCLWVLISQKRSCQPIPNLFGGKIMKKLSILGVILCASVVCAAPVSIHWSPANALSLSVDNADARVGRPLTPMSVAGVNRRVHRRAYYGAYAHPGYARPLCGYAPYPPCY